MQKSLRTKLNKVHNQNQNGMGEIDIQRKKKFQLVLPNKGSNHCSLGSVYMGEIQALQHRMIVTKVQEPEAAKGPITSDQPPVLLGLKRWQWWFLVSLNIAFLLVGQSAAVILGRFYFDQGGKSKWMATLVQTAASPILFLPLFFFPSPEKFHSTRPSILTRTLVYFSLGVLLVGDNMLYSVGLLYLPLSTYFLLCSTQLGFNAITSCFINSQKFTALVLNSVVLLTLSASLVAIHSDPTTLEANRVSKVQYAIGFVCTLGASAGYALLLSLMQLSFEKVLKRETFLVVLDMQIYTSLVATVVCVVGLFASGEWRGLKGEMETFGKGRVSYVMTLVGAALAWQISSVGVVGLIFVVSSLFSNVISLLALPLVPVAAVLFYHEKMDGVKVLAMFLAIWGLTSYLYQNYLDDNVPKKVITN